MATRRQTSTSMKRFKSHYDVLRTAYDHWDKTRAEMVALHVAKAEAAATTKEKNPRSTPNHKVDANAESDGSSYSGRSTRNSRPTTRQAKKETKMAPTLTVKMKEHAVDVILEHLKCYIDKRDMRHTTMLQCRVNELERKLEKTKKYWHKMRFSMKRGMEILEEANYTDVMKSKDEEMKDANDSRSIGGASKQ